MTFDRGANRPAKPSRLATLGTFTALMALGVTYAVFDALRGIVRAIESVDLDDDGVEWGDDLALVNQWRDEATIPLPPLGWADTFGAKIPPIPGPHYLGHSSWEHSD